MKPFNLEEYLTNSNKKIITRDNRNVRIVCTDAKGNYPIIALIENVQGNEIPFSYTKDGIYKTSIIDSKDLFFASEKHEGWINLYKNAMGYAFPSNIYQTEEEAKKGGRGNDSYLTTIKIEWKE